MDDDDVVLDEGGCREVVGVVSRHLSHKSQVMLGSACLYQCGKTGFFKFQSNTVTKVFNRRYSTTFTMEKYPMDLGAQCLE